MYKSCDFNQCKPNTYVVSCFAGVRLYQGVWNRTIPNYAMVAGRDIHPSDTGSPGLDNIGRLDGMNDGLWCQRAKSVGNTGSWRLPNGSAVPDDDNAVPIYQAKRPNQVGLLRLSAILFSPYMGMYTCTIPDENGVSQKLVVWAAGNVYYDGGTSDKRK